MENTRDIMNDNSTKDLVTMKLDIANRVLIGFMINASDEDIINVCEPAVKDYLKATKMDPEKLNSISRFNEDF